MQIQAPYSSQFIGHYHQLPVLLPLIILFFSFISYPHCNSPSWSFSGFVNAVHKLFFDYIFCTVDHISQVWCFVTIV